MAGSIVSDDRTRCQCLGFHLDVDFGIAVGGFERNVTEPRADGVDVHAGAEQVYGRRVPHRMGADSLRVERGHPCGSPSDRTFDDCVNAEPRQGLTAHVEKHRGLSWAIQTIAE
jgi:hypothetical protein